MPGPLIVATERLGWPSPPRWRWLPRIVEWQNRMVYEDRPDDPSATCHLQVAADEPALCGYPWEILIAVPGEVAWAEIHEDMRCAECTVSSGVEIDPAIEPRFSWHEA